MTLAGRNLPLARDLREAVVLYLKTKYPINTTLHVSKDIDLDKTTAKNLLKGHASDATITKAIRAGGWDMAMAVIGSVIGTSLDDHIENERAKHEQRAARLAQVARSLRARPDEGGLHSPLVDPRDDERGSALGGGAT